MATFAVAPFLLPVVVLVLGALQPVSSTAPTGWELIPLPPSLASLEAAFELEPLAGQALNSLLVVAVAVPLSVLCSSWAGFAITQLSPRRRRAAVGHRLRAAARPAARAVGAALRDLQPARARRLLRPADRARR